VEDLIRTLEVYERCNQAHRAQCIEFSAARKCS
jgi:hypothetical protein